LGASGSAAARPKFHQVEKDMRCELRVWVAVSGLAAATVTWADQTPIDIHTDLPGQYFLVERGGTPAKPTLAVKRGGPDWGHYIVREFDCEAHTVRFLGEGKTLAAAVAGPSDPDLRPIDPGSIPDQLMAYACPPPKP
jgi:hypothetical protein